MDDKFKRILEGIDESIRTMIKSTDDKEIDEASDKGNAYVDLLEEYIEEKKEELND